jgi:hypothetical protein
MEPRNRRHFGLIVAAWACDELTQTRFLDYEKNRKKTEKECFKTLGLQACVIIQQFEVKTVYRQKQFSY